MKKTVKLSVSLGTKRYKKDISREDFDPITGDTNSFKLILDMLYR